MNILDFVLRQKEMLRNFTMGKDVALNESGVEIRFFPFESSYNFQLATTVSKYALLDGSIQENQRFSYPIFYPKSRKKFSEAIVLLHGLNERNWDKYLCWAEYLAVHTKKPVVLFPIAYHINRSPELWSNPRSMSLLVRKRQEVVGADRSLCFANVALSERLSEDPARFYTSGKQTVEDLRRLATSLRNGDHPLFAKGTSVDFFAYSIGAFLAEITLMANQDHLFDRSKLFVFCGGSIFRSMFGESRFIMDKPAYDKLLDFYLNEWQEREKASKCLNLDSADDTRTAFDSMIAPEIGQAKREGFFKGLGNRISGISLKKDTVMPYEGVEACMGYKNASKKILLLDFPYEYSHESPFPTNDKIEPELLNASFNQVFTRAVHFLA
jgi:hypothetical protein